MIKVEEKLFKHGCYAVKRTNRGEVETYNKNNTRLLRVPMEKLVELKTPENIWDYLKNKINIHE